MKTFIIITMVVQVLLICMGVEFLIQGKIANGIVGIALNAIAFTVNSNTLTRL